MYKKIITITLIVVLVLGSNLTSFAKDKDSKENIEFDSEFGTVTITYDTEDYSMAKVLVKKENEQYVYNLTSNDETFPLQMGNGNYTVYIYDIVRDSGYKRKASGKIKLDVKDVNQNAVFLASVQLVNWDSESASTLLAKELTEGLDTEEEKVKAIHQHLVENITYDYGKVSLLTNRYLPNNESTLVSKKGLCYDYASLFAAMVRSIGIPTKLVKGDTTTTNQYHAWNEIFINDDWVILDVTSDAASWSKGIEYSFEKNALDYNANRVF